MIDKTFGRYRVLERIGRGGMGEVFLAEDTSLRRRVALKFLPLEMQKNPEALKRFIREARSAAALDHPYICHINEVAEAEGQEFIVMEYVDGETLRTKVGQGPLPLADTLQIAIEVAEALETAHGKGIVHRDIKPENIMLTRTGHAKVMDFGLAKQAGTTADAEIGAQTMTLLTSEGTTVGTLAYMSPEQLRGQSTDARSDIWSLGVTLYEMASGIHPFPGQSGFEVSSAILNKPPLSLPSQVPAGLGALIMHCLDKNPAKRYQSLGDLRADLEKVRAGRASAWSAWRYQLARRRWIATATAVFVVAALLFVLDVGGLRTRLIGGAGATAKPFKLAVLPFENLTGDPEQDYLSDGITQEMISQLSSLHPARMSVIARASVMQYKKSETPLAQVGQELSVAYIVEGTARREGNRIRIYAELIQVRDQTKLWDETYERDMSGILALQSDIARQVAGALAIKLLPSAEARLAKVRSVDPEAYEAYIKGIKSRENLSREGFDEAERYLNRAIERDPGYAAPWAAMAGVWTSRMQLGMVTREEGLIKAKSAALKAIGMDDGEIEARRVLAGILSWNDWDWQAAEPAWNRVFELDPDNALALPGYAHYLLVMGRKDEALARSGRALELDPNNIRTQSFHAIVLMHSRRFDEAIAMTRKVLSDQPNNGVARTALTISLFKTGRYDELYAIEKTRWAEDAEVMQAMELGYADSGFAGAMQMLADDLAARYGKPGIPRAIILANYYSRAGDKERVIEWLERAYEEHDNNMPYIGSDPIFDLARDDPRFQDIMRRVGLPVHERDRSGSEKKPPAL